MAADPASLHRLHKACPYKVIVGSILNKEAPPPPYHIYVCYLSMVTTYHAAIGLDKVRRCRVGRFKKDKQGLGRFKKDKQGLGRFKKDKQGLGRFKKDKQGLRRFKKDKQGLERLREVWEC